MDDDALQLIAIIVVITFVIIAIIFCAIPVTGSMKIETVNWQWEVKVYQYESVPYEVDSEKRGITYSDLRDAEAWLDEAKSQLVPADAYDVNVVIKRDTDRKKTGEDEDGNAIYRYYDYYHYIFTYRLNQWNYFNSVYASGTDAEPHEPERPYKEANEIPDWTVGMFSCGLTHEEKYTVSGTVKNKKQTFDISQADWQRLHDAGIKEIWFKKGRFDDHIDKIAFEKGEL